MLALFVVVSARHRCHRPSSPCATFLTSQIDNSCRSRRPRSAPAAIPTTTGRGGPATGSPPPAHGRPAPPRAGFLLLQVPDGTPGRGTSHGPPPAWTPRSRPPRSTRSSAPASTQQPSDGRPRRRPGQLAGWSPARPGSVPGADGRRRAALWPQRETVGTLALIIAVGHRRRPAGRRRPARPGWCGSTLRPLRPGRGDRDPRRAPAAGQRRGRHRRAGPACRTPTRAPRSARSAPRSTRCSTTSTHALNRAAGERGAGAPVRRRRQPRAAHPAGLDPRVRRADPPRAASRCRRRSPTRSAGSSPRRSG